MKNLYNKFLGDQVPIKERLLYIASFMSSFASLLMLSFAILMRMDTLYSVSFALISLAGFLCFFLEYRFHRTVLISHVYLTFINFVIFPMTMFKNETFSVEIPIYVFVGLTYSLVLLDGISRNIHFAVQIIVDITICYYCYYLNVDRMLSFDTYSTYDYLRLELAIFLTCVLSGTMILYRNTLLKKELENSEEEIDEAEQVNYAKDMFLVNVSHEIRTPLNAIMGTSEVLLDSEASEHIKEMVAGISNSSHALLSMTTDLLDFSRINEESLELTDSDYVLSALLNDIINLISVRLVDSPVEFYVDIDPEIPDYLRGDASKIRQILVNLLNNAIKYTESGFIKLTVKGARKEGSLRLTFSVADSGKGLDEETMKALCLNRDPSPDARVSVSHSVEIGLPVCASLANTLGGKLETDNHPGEGCEFSFSINQMIRNVSENYLGRIREKVSVAFFSNKNTSLKGLAAVLDGMGIEEREVFSVGEFIDVCMENNYSYYFLDASAYEKTRRRMDMAGLTWTKIVVIGDCNFYFSDEPFKYVLTKPVSCLNIRDLINKVPNYLLRQKEYAEKFRIPRATILVIDDNLINLEVANGLLVRYGCRVITAGSGREGIITLLAEKKTDLVFLDYMMPGMDGIETLHEIKRVDGGRFKNLPVAALTANAVSGAREMFLQEGFNDYLSKPIETDKLEKVLQNCLPEEYIEIDE